MKRVLDGDTFEADFDLGFRTWTRVNVRMAGYDAPETWRPKSAEEKQAGQKVTAYLNEIVNEYKDDLYCESLSIDIYARSLGILYAKKNGEFININDMLIKFIVDNDLSKQRFL